MKNLNKKEILKDHKDCILTLVRKSNKEIDEDKDLQQRFIEKWVQIQSSIKALNDTDLEWIKVEYKKWFDNDVEVQARVKETISKFPQIFNQS